MEKNFKLYLIWSAVVILTIATFLFLTRNPCSDFCEQLNFKNTVETKNACFCKKD